MKKFLSLLLILTLLACPILGSAAFSDVPESHWAYDEITYMEESYILYGYGDGTCRPEQPMTRAEFAKLFSFFCEVRMTQTLEYLHEKTPNPVPYADVSESHWASYYIGNIRLFMNDYQENGSLYFHPNDYITREEAAYALGKSLELFEPKIGSDFTFIDTSFSDEADISSAYLQNVKSSAKWGLFNGFEDGTFRPKKTLTRAEAITIIYRFRHLPIQRVYSCQVDRLNVSKFLKYPTEERSITSKEELVSYLTETAKLSPVINTDGSLITDSSEILTRYINDTITPDFFEENYLFVYYDYVWDISYVSIDQQQNYNRFCLFVERTDSNAEGAIYLIIVPKSEIKNPQLDLQIVFT